MNVNNSFFRNNNIGVLMDVSAGGILNLSGAGNAFANNVVKCGVNQGTGTLNGFLDFGVDGTCPP